MKRNSCFGMLLSLILLHFHVSAQYKMVMNSAEFPVNLDWVYEQLPEDHEFLSEADELRYIADLSHDQLLEAAQKAEFYDPPSIENSTLYFAEPGFVAESQSEEGHSRVLYLSEDNIIYMISEESKQAFYMSRSDIEEIDDMVSDAYDGSESDAVYDFDDDQEDWVDLKASGKSMTINGFACDEYVSLSEARYVQVWATKDNFGLTDEINNMVDKLKSSFDTDSEDDQSDLMYQVPGHINILMTEISNDMMSGLLYRREEYTDIEKTEVPAALFKKPTAKDGYTLMSYKDLFKQMQESFEESMGE